MKSMLFSRFFILLPWILIVIIMLDVDTRRPAPPLTPRPYFSPYAGGRGGARIPLRRSRPDGRPGRGLEKLNESRSQAQPEPQLPTIYAITPTYSRPVQKAELTRLANTFRQVAQLHWIVVEDAAARSELVSRFLARAGLPSTHLHVPTPRRYKRPGLPRATEQRNAGLAWLRQRHQHLLLHQRAQPGVLFFADDDNTYSLELFQEMRTTRKVSVWPVGLVGGRRYERPLVKNGRVVGWYTGWRADRPFAIDMAVTTAVLIPPFSEKQEDYKRNFWQPVGHSTSKMHCALELFGLRQFHSTGCSTNLPLLDITKSNVMPVTALATLEEGMRLRKVCFTDDGASPFNFKPKLGFAVSLQVILSNPKAVFKRRGSQPGMQESDFLKQITTVEELEPKANNCTKVLVWHTRTEKVNLANEPKYHLDTVKIEV